MLVETASIIKKAIRDSDLAGRYGGEEFILVFENAPLAADGNLYEAKRTGRNRIV